jgi:hypothetical protein
MDHEEDETAGERHSMEVSRRRGARRGHESQGIRGLVAAPLHHFGKVYIYTEPRAITSVLLGLPGWSYDQFRE